MNRKPIKKHAVMMEYVIIAVLIAAAVVVAVAVFGRTVKSEFNVATTAMVDAKGAQTQQKSLKGEVTKGTKDATDHANAMNSYGAGGGNGKKNNNNNNNAAPNAGKK